MNYYPPWGSMPFCGGQQAQQPFVFMSPPANNPSTNQSPQSWQEVAKLAKREIKREAKLKAKWDTEAKKKKDGELKKPMLPLLPTLFFSVLVSPIVGLPTLYFYKSLFAMWGSALGVK